MISNRSHQKRFYSLRKSCHLLRWGYSWYKKKGASLSAESRSFLEDLLGKLDAALLEKDKEKSSELAYTLEAFGKEHFKKSIFNYCSELIISLIIALLIASLVRQVWFEPYEIPTGSMRPTFKEKDRLTVSKLAFGINLPTQTKHIFFDPDLVQRTEIIIFSADGLPMSDADTTYFGLFPYKKRLVKRCMGKPGDSLYFYGGKVYGIDRNGHELPELLTAPWMEKIEHIPYMTFEGEITNPNPKEILFLQAHQPIGRIFISENGNRSGEVFNGKEWIKDQPAAPKTDHHQILTYSDFWGMRNYAMARLLTKQQAMRDHSAKMENVEEGVLYLELRHTPSLTSPAPVFYKETYGTYLKLSPQISIIPLQKQHLKAILDNMYTARFVVVNGRAKRYEVDNNRFGADAISFNQVPDGTYEFYYGKALNVGWGAITSVLPPEHPLYDESPANIQKLFNLGIEMSAAYAPSQGTRAFFPHRYAYFRDGDFYLMGAPILKKEDPTLVAFNKREEKKEKAFLLDSPSIGFKDYGPPIKDGKIDQEFIRTFGLTVPDKHYLALGDNHAMSADSRAFGFVPEDNMQGAPSIIIWPPGDRIGPPPQQRSPVFTTSRLIVWFIVLQIGVIWYYKDKNRKKPIFKKLEIK